MTKDASQSPSTESLRAIWRRCYLFTWCCPLVSVSTWPAVDHAPGSGAEGDRGF